MSATTSTATTDTPRGSTVADAASTISSLLAREDGEPEQGEDTVPGADTLPGGEQADEPEIEPEIDPEGDDEGEDEGEPERDEEGQEPEPLDPEKTVVPVTIDGKVQQVSLAELVKGYHRTADYTRKTMALAENVKAVQQKEALVQQERAQYATLLPAFIAKLEAMSATDPNWEELSVTDPVEFNRLWAAKQLREQQIAAAQAEQQRVAWQHKQQRDALDAEHTEAERAKLFEANPRWSDPVKWKADQAKVREYLIDQGFTPQDLSGVKDHRIVLITHKARLYDEAMAKMLTRKPNGAGKPTPRPAAPPVQQPPAAAASRPGSSAARRPVSELTRAKMRLGQTHNLRDAAAVIERLL